MLVSTGFDKESDLVTGIISIIIGWEIERIFCFGESDFCLKWDKSLLKLRIFLAGLLYFADLPITRLDTAAGLAPPQIGPRGTEVLTSRKG